MAVIITITALSLKAPNGTDFSALGHRLPALLVYILSFAFVGIYWNNHHHLLRATRNISGGVMWANLHLLFWLSLIPVITEWVGTDYRSTWPAATYGSRRPGCGDRLQHSGGCHRAGGWSAIAGGDRNRFRPQGTALSGDLCGRRRICLPQPVDLVRLVRLGVDHVVHPRSAIVPTSRYRSALVASCPVLSRGKGARRSGAAMDDPYDLERFVTAQNGTAPTIELSENCVVAKR